MDRAAIYTFMAHERYAVLSSVGEDGSPQSALVGIAVTPELQVIFDTLRSSRKYSNLRRSARCSLVIGLGGSAGQITVQLQGVAREPAPKELGRYLEVYFAAWPDGRDRLEWPGITHFVVRPGWVRYSDFAQVPLAVEELTLPD